jgi:hypothetical protein
VSACWSGPWECNGDRPLRYVLEDGPLGHPRLLGAVTLEGGKWLARVAGQDKPVGTFKERHKAMAAVQAAQAGTPPAKERRAPAPPPVAAPRTAAPRTAAQMALWV